MKYTPPLFLKILTDDNELEFLRTIKNKSVETFLYKFTKSKTKLNMEMELSESSILKYLMYSFKVL